jgi:hypothetical protein
MSIIKKQKLNLLLSNLNLKIIQRYLSSLLSSCIIYSKLRQNSEIDFFLMSSQVYPASLILKMDSTLSASNLLVDIAVVDYPLKQSRFFLNYSFLSMSNIRFNLQTSLSELTSILSITSL